MKKTISILCVEDGSVDIDNLESEGLHDGKILVFRQGAVKPFVLEIPVNSYFYKENKKALREIKKIYKRNKRSGNGK